jgi:hypothetical protein
VAEVTYDPESHGWFRLSRRLVSSSRWVKGSPAAVKLLVYLVERATNPMNPTPGDVLECGAVLAHNVAMSEELTAAALAELLGPDVDSRSKRAGGAVLEPLTMAGSVVGYRLVNFEEHNPGDMERGAARRAETRRRKAKAAAESRWSRARAATLALQPEDIPARDGRLVDDDAGPFE